MKVLLIGGGGREHALGWKIKQSPLLSKLYLAPGNPGLNTIGEKVDLDPGDNKAIVSFAIEKSIDLVVVGPEAPLAAGLGDALSAANICCFGPSQEAAKLESSKAYMKAVCEAAGADTAAYGQFTDQTAAKAFLRTQSAPYVIKADGLAAGKGVVIANTLQEADSAVEDMLGGRFGDASAEIVIEEFMEGEEASFFAISDGENILPLIAAQDHKRAYDYDKGPNTGGMGAYSPAPVFTNIVRDRTINNLIKPVIAEMKKRGTPYRGVLYAGLMIKNEHPRLIEFNVRFGDPECQILMRLMTSDLLPILDQSARGTLETSSLEWSNEACALVVLAAKGYPEAYEKGTVIKGVEKADALDDVVVFHAGTSHKEDELVAAGGRVLNITASGSSIRDAVDAAYRGVDCIDWPDGFCRRDIGWRALGENT